MLARACGEALGRRPDLALGRRLDHGLPGRAPRRHFDALGARQVAARGRIGVGAHLFVAALGHDAAAMHARARPQVDDLVGRAHHVLVVLDHDDAVADVAQVLQRADELVVVALVQSDAGLVQHIHHARQAAADLAGQADALGLAAGQRVGPALQAQVAQAHVVEEQQARGDLSHHLARDLGLGARQLQGRAPGMGLGQRGMAHLVDGAGLLALADAHEARLAAQPRAAAVGADGDAAQPRQVVAHHAGLGLAPAPRDVGDDALEGMALDQGLALARTAVEDIGEGHFLLARAPQHHVAHLLGQLLEGQLHIGAIVARHALQHGEVVAVAPVPALDGAAGQAQRGKGHHALGIEGLRAAQAVAARAGAHGRVEREQARLQLGQRIAAQRAGELGAEEVFLAAVHLQGDHAAAGVGATRAQGGLETLGQALLGVGTHLEAVDHHVDVVALVLLQRGQGMGLVDLAVDAKAHIALGLHLREQLGELSLLVARQRPQHHEARVLGQGQGRIHHLADGLGLQRQVVVGAVGRAGACEQQAQVVVDLGHRAHGGARVVAGGLLLDADGGRQALDQVHIGLVQPPQELARIGRQALHIAALALGVQGVEGQAGLARARQPGDHHQPVARNVQVDVLEVVRARTADGDA